MLGDIINSGIDFFDAFCQCIEELFRIANDPNVSIFGFSFFELLLASGFVVAIFSVILSRVFR